MEYEPNQSIKLPDFSHHVFGGVLESDSAGYYPGLELLNLIYCNHKKEMLPTDKEIKVFRQSMDFARKLVWDSFFHTDPRKEEVLVDQITVNNLAKLLECLQLEIPNAVKKPAWHRAHFFPYTENLIHYDARRKKRTEDVDHKVEIERKYLRGSGALAFKVLRLNPNAQQKEQISRGLENMFSGSEKGALDKIVKVFREKSLADENPSYDEIEDKKTTCRNDELDEIYRFGVANILSYESFSPAIRTKALVKWTGIWLTLAQSARAENFLDPESSMVPFIIDAGNSNKKLRQASSSNFKEKLSSIERSIEKAIDQYNVTAPSEKYFKLSGKARSSIRGFFSLSCATLELVNSFRGKRHFTLGVNALETFVMAGIKEGDEQEYSKFLNDWLGKRCRLLIGHKLAEELGYFERFDGSIFKSNDISFSNHLRAAGLLTEYSDETKMVGLKANV